MRESPVDALLRQAQADHPERFVPIDPGLEADLLAAVLQDPPCIGAVLDVLEPEDFFEPAHGLVYAVMRDLTRAPAPVPVDLVTVAAELARRRQLDAAGGRDALTAWQRRPCTPANVPAYAAELRRYATQRRLISVGGAVAALAYEPRFDADAALAGAAGLLAALAGRGAAPARTQTEVAAETWEDIARRARGEIVTMPTGFAKLDEAVSGWEPGQLVILAAQTGRGKTALALQFATTAAAAGFPVAILSLEMQDRELLRRQYARAAQTGMTVLRRGTLGEAGWARMQAAYPALAGLPICYLDPRQSDPEGLLFKVRRLQADQRFGCALLVVDYLQLASGHGATREQEVASIIRGLKRIALDCQIVVLALSQFSRAADDRAEPRLSDLRESGAIEHAADVVLALHQPDPEVYTAHRLYVLKQRDGERNVKLSLHWDGAYQTFSPPQYA